MRRFLPIGSTRVGPALAMHQLRNGPLNAEVRSINNNVPIPLGVLVSNAATFHHRLFSTTSFALAPEEAPASQAKLGSGSASMGKGNYFAFFDFPVDPTLDVAVLQKRYHALQRQFHPDQRQQQEDLGKRPGGQDAERDTSSDGGQVTSSEMDTVSTYANEAYSVLKDPFLRCRYLNKWRRATERKNANNNAPGEEAPLSTVALTVEEEEALAIDDDRAVKDKENAALDDLDEEFLMEMMIMNELIFTGDRSQEMIRNQLLVLKADLKERNEEQFDLAKECWAEKDWRGFTACIHKWTYTWNAWNNLIDRL